MDSLSIIQVGTLIQNLAKINKSRKNFKILNF